MERRIYSRSVKVEIAPEPTPHLQEVIMVEKQRGVGTEADPIRMAPQCWTTDGILLFEYDPKAKCPHCGLWLSQKPEE